MFNEEEKVYKIKNVKQMHDFVLQFIKLRNLIKCSVCLDVVDDLISIECKHVFCSNCLKQHESINSKNHRVQCPICRCSIKRQQKIESNEISAIIEFITNVGKKLQDTFKCDLLELCNEKTIKEKLKAMCLENQLEGSTSSDMNEMFNELLKSENNSLFALRPKKTYKSPKEINTKSNLTKILNFEDSSNRDMVVKWLNDNRNKFNRVTQTQVNTCSDIPLSNSSFDMQSISQNKNFPKRSTSLDGTPKQVALGLPMKRHSITGPSIYMDDVEIDEYSSNERKTVEEKVAVLDMMEEKYLNSIETEVLKTKDNSNEIEGKKKRKKTKKDDIVSKTTGGWKRMKEMKRTIRKTIKTPKKLPISRSNSPSSDLDNRLKNLKCQKSDYKPVANTTNSLLSKFVIGSKKNKKRTNRYSSSSSSCELTKTNGLKSKKMKKNKENENTSHVIVTAAQVHHNNRDNSDEKKEQAQSVDLFSLKTVVRNKNDDSTEVLLEKIRSCNIIENYKKLACKYETHDDKIKRNELIELLCSNVENLKNILKNLKEFQSEKEHTMSKIEINSTALATTETFIGNCSQGVQTDLTKASHGFRISSNELFKTIQCCDKEVETEELLCPECNYAFNKRNDFSTSDKSTKSKENSDETVSTQNQNAIHLSKSRESDLTTKTVDTTALIIDLNTQFSPENKITNRKLNFDETDKLKQSFKRTRSPEADSSGNVKKICRNENLEDKPTQIINLSEDNSTVDYDEHLQTHKKMFKVPTQSSKGRTQDMIEKCERIITTIDKKQFETGKETNVSNKLTNESSHLLSEFVKEPTDYFPEAENVLSAGVLEAFENTTLTEPIKLTGERWSQPQVKNDKVLSADIKYAFEDEFFDDIKIIEAPPATISKNCDINVSSISHASDKRVSSRISQKNVKSQVENLFSDSFDVFYAADLFKTNQFSKINIIQDIRVDECCQEQGKQSDGEASDDLVLSDIDIVETTPQKKKISILSLTNENKQLQKENSPDIISSLEMPFIPPPVEFRDNEEKELSQDTPLEKSNIINVSIDNTSTSYFNLQNRNEEVINLSPISLEKKPKQLTPIEAARISSLSPLSIIIKSYNSQRVSQVTTSTPKQKSILSYVLQTETNNENVNISQTLKKPCIACTRLNKDQIIAISSLTTKKLATYSSSFSSSVTHMIVMVNEENCVKDQTIKYILAVASGIWVLNYKWIQDCLAQNCIVAEEQYEALDISGLPGPKQSRLTRQQKPLFRGFKIYAAPPFISTTREDVENVIILLGGKIVSKPNDLLLDKNGDNRLIITEERATQIYENYEVWRKSYNVATVDIEWLSQSVGQYQLLSLRPFLLCSDNISNLGYSPDLLISEPSSPSECTYNTTLT